jgi:hypothetical protein
MRAYYLACVCVLFASAAFATVTVSQPSNGLTVGSPVQFVASASTSTCSKGVGSMGIYTAPYQLAYVVNGASLNTKLTLSPGTYNTVVEEWDNCGGATTTPITITVTGSTGVFVTAPLNNSQVGSPVNFVATATTSTCSKGVGSMGIYTAPYQLAYVVNGSTLNTNLTLSPGTYNTVVEEWDNCGGAAVTPVTITVTGTAGKTFKNLQSSVGWTGYGQLPPDYQDCSSCGSSVTWSSTQGISSPSLSGKSMQFNIGGIEAYADVLWNNHLIGDFSSQGLPDTSHTLVPTLHNYTYDIYFYGTNLQTAQALEFDVNQFFNNLGFTWGHECRTGGGNEWDIWDNVNGKWIPTGIACYPLNNSWNHLIIQVQRTTDNQLLYQSITLNGVKNTLNWYYAPFSAPGWYGITVNYQLDGNYKQQAYTTYIDDFNFTYY